LSRDKHKFKDVETKEEEEEEEEEEVIHLKEAR
jgi:hypothetical protein